MKHEQTQYRPLTEKNIFMKKLSGEPIDITDETMHDMLGNDVCLLLKTGVLEDAVGQFDRFICRYPIRIWHRYKGKTIKVDWLKQGDIWEYGLSYE